jgi:soluble lytic murein transglycosylase-like protein
MLKDNMKSSTGAVSRKVLLLTLVLSCLIVMPGFAMVFAARDLVKPVNAAYTAEEVNPVILLWMRNNSGMPEQVLSDIYRAAANNINSDLILAICVVESNFNPNVKSEKGAIGLMGILPAAWLDELKAQGIVQEKEDLYQISNNIASGAYVLQKYLSKTKTLEKALIAYVGGDPDYVRKVMKALGELYLAKWSRPVNA